MRRDDPDEVSRDENNAIAQGEVEEPVDPDFDEPTYLRAFPDIAEAVRRGTLASGLAHFHQAGRAEARLEKVAYRTLLEASVSQAAPNVVPQVVVDTLTVSSTGSTLMTGWSDDRFDPLTEIDLDTTAETRHNWAAFPRLIRGDVERTLDAPSGHRFGFLLVAAPIDRTTPGPGQWAASAPTFRFASGVENRPTREPVLASDAGLRDLALAVLPTAAGDLDTEAVYGILDQHVGAQIAAINRMIVDQARSSQLIEHFGPTRGRYRGSIITTLRGGADQIVPRLALTGGGPGADEYEFIVVITSADQFAPAWRAARVAESTLGLSLTIVLQHGGDPTGSGADAALDIARSDRLIFMDQAVLPRDRDWAARHSALLDGAPSEQTRLLGGLLYQSDGSLSNSGYYFERETSLQPRQQGPARRMTSINLKMAAHVAPSESTPAARPVAGVPAAFMSVDRAWFETLGGFTGHYSRAVYEDIDLCLRSFKRGVPAWVHPLRMWNFDRRPPVRSEPLKGGAILNGWLLHRQWDAMIVDGLPGKIPSLIA